MLLTYVSMGAARGLLIASFAAATEIPAEPNYLGRLVSSAWIFFFWAAIWTFVVESSERHRQELDDLNLRLHQIQSLQRGRLEAIASLRAEYLSRVEKILAPALDKVRGAVDLEELARKIIDPHVYAEIASKIQLAQELGEEANSLRLRDVGGLILQARFPAISVAVLGVLSLSVPVLWNSVAYGAVYLAVTALLIWLAVAALGISSRLSPVIRAGLALLPFSANTALGFFFESQLQSAGLSLASLTVGMWMIAIFTIFFIALERERRGVSGQLKGSLESLDRLQSKLQQELWLEQKQLGQLIHSEVQGRLRAAAVTAKLTGLESDLAALKRECIAALSGSKDQMTLVEFWEEIQTLWGRALKLSIKTARDSESAIERDPYLRSALFSIVREGILNAVKHGSCSHVDCEVTIDASGLVRLVIANDGSFSEANRAGLGTEMLDQLCLSWSLTRENQTTFLTADLAGYQGT